MAKQISRLDAARSRYQGELSSRRIPEDSLEAIRTELTYHSNAIEGNTLTLRETQMVIEGLAPQGGKSLREVYEARNHDRALRWIEKRVAQGPGTITQQDLLDVHRTVLADIDSKQAGEFRSDRVLITGTAFVPPGSQKFPWLIPRMLELANRSDVHPALLAAEFHYNIGAVHPFRDGNGRTARLMMNHLLLQHGFWHTVIEVQERADYLAALDEANSGRWEQFAIFIVQCMERSIQRLLGPNE